MTNRTPHILFTLAEQADARYSATVAARTDGKRDRWTMTADDLISSPEIREAYRAKVTADEAWLTFLRTDSIRRSRVARCSFGECGQKRCTGCGIAL